MILLIIVAGWLVSRLVGYDSSKWLDGWLVGHFRLQWIPGMGKNRDLGGGVKECRPKGESVSP